MSAAPNVTPAWKTKTNIFLSYPIFCTTTKASNAKYREQNWDCVRLILVSFISSAPVSKCPISYGLVVGQLAEVTYPSATFLPQGSKNESLHPAHSAVHSNPE